MRMIQERNLLSRFYRYVQVDSESGNEGAFCQLLLRELEKMGVRAHMDTAGKKIGSNGGNIYCYLPGTLSGEPLLLVAHTDTVGPGCGIKPKLQGDIITSEGETVLGGDDKSGVALIMENMQVLLDNHIPHRPIEVLFTISEERGLLGSTHLDYS